MSSSGEHAVTARAPSLDVPANTTETVDHIKIVAPLKGTINVRVSEGSLVKKGDLIAVQVSAKTELQIVAPEGGYIRNIVGDGLTLDENSHVAALEVV